MWFSELALIVVSVFVVDLDEQLFNLLAGMVKLILVF